MLYGIFMWKMRSTWMQDGNVIKITLLSCLLESPLPVRVSDDGI